jgi:hypothetical protein
MDKLDFSREPSAGAGSVCMDLVLLFFITQNRPEHDGFDVHPTSRRNCAAKRLLVENSSRMIAISKNTSSMGDLPFGTFTIFRS